MDILRLALEVSQNLLVVCRSCHPFYPRVCRLLTARRAASTARGDKRYSSIAIRCCTLTGATLQHVAMQPTPSGNDVFTAKRISNSSLCPLRVGHPWLNDGAKSNGHPQTLGDRNEPVDSWCVAKDAMAQGQAGNWPAALAIVVAPLALTLSFALFLHHPLTTKYVFAFDAALLVPLALVFFHIRREFARRVHERRDPRSWPCRKDCGRPAAVIQRTISTVETLQQLLTFQPSAKIRSRSLDWNRIFDSRTASPGLS